MKLSTILGTLASARLPSVTSEQLQQLVGTAEGKAFAEDLKWYAAGETKRRDQLATVVNALAPGVRRSVEQMGLQFDLPTVIAAAKRDGDQLFDAIKAGPAKPANRAQTVGYLLSIGLKAAAVDPAAVPAASPAEPPYYSFKIFGGAAALCVSEARTRIGGLHTVQIEGAGVLSGGTSRRYDWPNKIIVQLTPQEAYQLLALLEHHIDAVKFCGHGSRHDKSLHIELQGNLYFAKLFQKGRAAIMVPVPPVEAMPLISLLYKQILLNEPHLDITSVQQMVSRMGSMMGSPSPKRSHV